MVRRRPAPDSRADPRGISPRPAGRAGKNAVLGLFGRLVQDTGGTFQVELHDLLAGDTHAVALQVNRATRNGNTIQYKDVVVYHMSDQKVTEVWAIWENPDEHAAFYA